MPEARPPAPGTLYSGPLRTCPDCGGILEVSQPPWTAMVSMAAGTSERLAEPPRWQCLICGYRDYPSGR